MRSNAEGQIVRFSRLHANKFSTGTLKDAEVTLTFEHPTVLSLTPTAARDVNLPADAEEYRGPFFILFNLAAATHGITLKNAADATVGTVAATKSAMVVLSDSGVWKVVAGA